MVDRRQLTAPTLVLARDAIFTSLSRQESQAYERFVAWLASAGVADDALKVGDAAPDFLMPDAYGRLVASRDLRRTGPLILSFIRGDWCAFCLAELRAWYAALPAIHAAGARLLIVTPDVGSYARDMIAREGLEGLEIVADLDCGLALTFGIVFVVPETLRTVLRAQKVDLPARHGAPGWLLPVPATYIIDTRGIVRHAYVEPDYSRRQDPCAVKNLLRDIAAGKA